MIKGIGIDIIELTRIERIIHRQPRFVDKVLTSHEFLMFNGLSSKRQVEFVAGRFAAKEALSKALGSGVGKEFSWQDVSIITLETGAPQVVWHREEVNFHTHLSISHSQDYACAQALLEEKN